MSTRSGSYCRDVHAALALYRRNTGGAATEETGGSSGAADEVCAQAFAGYRAGVATLPGQAAGGALSEHPRGGESAGTAAAAAQTSRDRRGVAASVAAAAYQWRHMAGTRVPAIGVIGFKNDSGNADYDWLATELSETLSAELTGSQQIHVVPAEDVARLKIEMSLPSDESLAKEDPAQVRAALGATYLVSGSYTIAGARRCSERTCQATVAAN